MAWYELKTTTDSRGCRSVIRQLSRVVTKALLLWWVWIMLVGCGSSTPLSSTPLRAFEQATSFDPSRDQNKIAAHHREHAVVLRQKAMRLADTARHYEQLFGPESDQATGTKTLAQYYEDAAERQEQLAEAHAEAARTGRAPKQ